mgnify:CR=1 FL=1
MEVIGAKLPECYIVAAAVTIDHSVDSGRQSRRTDEAVWRINLEVISTIGRESFGKVQD